VHTSLDAPDLFGELVRLARATPLPEFEARFPNPWLVRLDTTAAFRMRPGAIAPVEQTVTARGSKAEAMLRQQAQVWPIVKRQPTYPDYVSVGRADSNDIVICLPSVSFVHALIDRDATGHWLTDIGSKNGTMVDRHVVTRGDRVRLTEGQSIRFGGVAVAMFTGSAALWKLCQCDVVA